MPDPLDLYSFHESRSCWRRGGFLYFPVTLLKII